MGGHVELVALQATERHTRPGTPVLPRVMAARSSTQFCSWNFPGRRD